MVHGFAGKKPDVHNAAFLAWNAEVEGEVELGKESSIWFGAVLRGDIAAIKIGPFSNVQDCAVLHVAEDGPCLVGEGVTIGHGAIVHACTVGDYSLVGMGAVILNRAEIGPESIVGAGALVTQGKKFPPRSMILGNPARRIRDLTEEEIHELHTHARGYVELAKRTKADMGED